MKITKLVNRELRQEEKATIERLNYYTGGKAGFVCLGEHTVAPLSENCVGDINAMLEEANAIIDETLNSHPDFSHYTMDDGYFVVMMDAGPIVVSPKKLEEYTAEGITTFALALELRAECLELCEKAEIVAVVEPDEG